MNNRAREPWLYLITDRKACEPGDVVTLIAQAAAAGVDLVQIREKDLSARALCQLVERAVAAVEAYATRVLVNDRFDVALACGAHGVHLTTQSLPTRVVRAQVGDRLMIGVSTHSLEEVRRAEREGADFVVCGPVFETPSKQPYGPPLGLAAFAEIVRQTRLPVLGIGGIDLTNFRRVLACGARGIAAIRLFMKAPSVEDVVGQLKRRSS